MSARIIDFAEQIPFFARFSRLHDGSLVTLRVGSQDEVVDQPFRGVSPDGKDFVIHTGGGSHSANHGHRVRHVTEVRLVETDEGADAMLEMVSDDGTTTEVKFHSPIRADLLDRAVE